MLGKLSQLLPRAHQNPALPEEGVWGQLVREGSRNTFLVGGHLARQQGPEQLEVG